MIVLLDINNLLVFSVFVVVSDVPVSMSLTEVGIHTGKQYSVVVFCCSLDSLFFRLIEASLLAGSFPCVEPFCLLCPSGLSFSSSTSSRPLGSPLHDTISEAILLISSFKVCCLALALLPYSVNSSSRSLFVLLSSLFISPNVLFRVLNIS